MGNTIGNAAIMGATGAEAFDIETGALKCTVDYMVDFSLDDQTEVQYIRGDYGFLKLLPIMGERNVTINVGNASNSVGLLELMSNNKAKSGSRIIPQEAYVAEIKANKVTLPKVPATGEKIEVWKLNAYGVRDTKMELVETPTPTSGQFKISGKDLTFAEEETGSVEVFYSSEELLVTTIAPEEMRPQASKIVIHLLLQSIETKKYHTATMLIHNGTINPSFSLKASNSGEVPESVPLAIEALATKLHKAPYELLIDENERVTE